MASTALVDDVEQFRFFVARIVALPSTKPRVAVVERRSREAAARARLRSIDENTRVSRG
jgi:hypothetical protein